MDDNDTGDRAEQVALFRFAVISEVVSPRLTPAERGVIVRALAARTWTTPEGVERCFARGTIDRWLVEYRRDGHSGLRPTQRSDRGRARSQGRWLAEAERMRRAIPSRSAAKIVDGIFRAHGVVLSERTVRAHLRRAGLTRAALTAEPTRAFGRYEASSPNEIWIGDVLVGPFVPHPRVAGSRRAKLFVLVDDYSRLLVHGRWMTEENTRSGQDVLRSAIARRGVPQILHVDNGAPYANHQLARACVVLGVHLVHSKPYAPQGRGKQERLNSYIRQSFIAEMEDRGIGTFEELNDFSWPGLSRWPTPEPTPRPNRRPSNGSSITTRRPSHPRPCWPRRSGGRWSAESPRPRRSTCSPTATRSIPPSWGAASSCASTPKTWRPSRRRCGR
jgi:putative transposase